MEGFKNFGPDRIVGISKGGESAFKNKLYLHVLENQEREEGERNMTLEECDIFDFILEKIPEFLKEYSIEPSRKTFLTQIHILDKDYDINIRQLEDGTAGFFEVTTGRINILSEDENNYFKEAHILVHELMHANSFLSFEFKHEGGSHFLDSRRSGLAISSKEDKKLFKFLNEAVTEELTRRFASKYFDKTPHISETYKEFREREIQHVNNSSDVSLGEEKPDYKDFDRISLAYANERISLIFLVQELFERNKEDFESAEDVFKLFASAYFTGRILPVARLIEKTFGKGFFKIIGEKMSEPSPDFSKYINNNKENISNDVI